MNKIFILVLIILFQLVFGCVDNSIPDDAIHDITLNDNDDVSMYPHWEMADALKGKDKRFTHTWIQIASSGKRVAIAVNQPIGDYMIDIISAKGLTLIYEAVIDETGTEIFYLRDTIMADELSDWILNDNL